MARWSNGAIMKSLTAPRMERCIGCHSCSLACGRLVHQSPLVGHGGHPHRPASGGLSTGFEAKTCLACDPAPCAEACPTGAYSQRKGGGVVVRKKLCIQLRGVREGLSGGCHLSWIAPGEPFVCIHCGRCVPFCPHDCLELNEEDGIQQEGSPPPQPSPPNLGGEGRVRGDLCG